MVRGDHRVQQEFCEASTRFCEGYGVVPQGSTGFHTESTSLPRGFCDHKKSAHGLAEGDIQSKVGGELRVA